MTETAFEVLGSESNISTGVGPFFIALSGTLSQEVTTEALAQIQIGDTLTAANLLIKVDSFSGTAATLRTRIGGANGSLSVSVNTTGTFEDTVDSDSLVSGNLYNYEYVPGSGNCFADALGVTLAEASSMTSYLVKNSTGSATSGTGNNFVSPEGRYASGNGSSTIATLTFRYATTFGNPFGGYISANTLSKASNIKLYHNGAAAVDISVGSGATGLLTSSTTVAVAAGDTATYNYTVANGSTGSATMVFLFMQNQNSVHTFTHQNSYAGSGSISFNVTTFMGLSGDLAVQTVESKEQMKVRGVALTAEFFFVEVPSNSTNGSTTISLRDNATTTALKVSIGAAATGIFEDTSDTVSIALGDLLDHQVDTTASTSGSITPHQVGESYAGPSAAPTVYAMPGITTVTLSQYTSATPYA